jgi:hypothetical protein
MTHFPQSNPAQPATRVKLHEPVLVAIRVQGAHSVRAMLHEVSATGGILILAKPLEQGEFVEVAFKTSEGAVYGMAEILQAKLESSKGCLQTFRFVALDDEAHNKLCMALQTFADRTTLVVPSSRGLHSRQTR